jgi:pimeloyl-ACP methyl ester carboxylesterase
MMMKPRPAPGILPLLLLLLTPAFAENKVELGEINGAKFRIDVPEKWNGGLVMYCHGYNPKPASYNDKANPMINVFLEQGYAVAQSGYAAGGWAIQEGVVDTENLRRYFLKKYGPAKETYVTGHSMGGFITMTLMETNPTVYDAGLPLCGPLAAPAAFMARGAFDGVVLFNYYFPGILPEPTRIPSDYVGGREVAEKVEAALNADESKAAVLRAQNGNKNNKDLAGVLSFVVYTLKEIGERAGGNAFDNRNVIYNHTPDDNAVNAGVKRYAADPKALDYIRTYYTPSGRISKPMLAIHTSYDPLVPTWIPNSYQSLVDQSGTSNLFVQQYVKHDGHCTITPQEIGKGFSQLREWKSSGVRPNGGDQAAPSSASAGSR